MTRLVWANAKIAQREKGGKQSTLEVDHVVAWDLWRTKTEESLRTPTVSREPITAVSISEDLDGAVNDLGNCLLLEKNFNISKSNKPLKELLDKVHDFKEGQLKLAQWAQALDLYMAQVDSAASSLDVLCKLFAERTAKIRGHLEEFVRGNQLRVDLDETSLPQNGAVQFVDAEQAAGMAGKGKRDVVRIEFMREFKQRLSAAPHLSEIRLSRSQRTLIFLFFVHSRSGRNHFSG